MRRLAAASAILATLLALSVAPVAATHPSVPVGSGPDSVAPAVVAGDADSAAAALEYLLAAQGSDGSIDASLGETADLVIGTADAGFDPATLMGCAGTTGALDFLASASDAASGDAAKTGKLVLAVVAAGADPTSFDGRDLVARLTALYHAGSGAYGDGSTFGQSFAILGLLAAGQSVPSTATAKLAALQDPDGSWSYGSAPVEAGVGDTNSTAIALMALGAAGVHTADPAALTYLHSQQLADGGFPYQNADTYGPPTSDPDSDAVVIEALLAAGEDPTASDWSQGSSNALTHLRSMQGSDGGFEYPGSGESAFTTSQVPAALMRMPYGAVTHFTAGAAVPTSACAATPTPTPTPTPTTGTLPSPTATKTPKPTPKPTAHPTPKPTPRLTATPTVSPQESTAVPATPTAGPSPISTLAPAPSPSPTPDRSEQVAGATSVASGQPGDASPGDASPGDANPGDDSRTPPSGGLPAPLVYGLAVALGLAAVLGAGWVLVLRPGRRP